MASDSIRARPMIMASWMRAAAPGCRAIASTAAATARPCPSPHRPAAIAMPMAAAMTVNGASHPPAAGASAARARPGNARTNRAPNIDERRTTVLLCTCDPRLVLARVVMLRTLTVVRLFDRSRDVQHRQHDEDERLEEGHQELQGIEKAHRERDGDGGADAADERADHAARQRPADQSLQAHQEKDDGEQDVPAHHVAEEPERKRQRPGEVADELDRHDEPGEPPHRPHEVFDVVDDALLAHADRVIGEEND